MWEIPVELCWCCGREWTASIYEKLDHVIAVALRFMCAQGRRLELVLNGRYGSETHSATGLVPLTHLPLFWFVGLRLFNVFIALTEMSNLLAVSAVFCFTLEPKSTCWIQRELWKCTHASKQLRNTNTLSRMRALYLSNSIEPSPSREANSCTGSQ